MIELDRGLALSLVGAQVVEEEVVGGFAVTLRMCVLRSGLVVVSGRGIVEWWRED